MTEKVKWLAEPEAHDYAAAAEYLSLLMDGQAPVKAAEKLRGAIITRYKAKDILRASLLVHLDEENPHVAKDLKKVKDKQPLSPILLVRGDLKANRPLVIADGYHRACAALHIDENAEVPCKIIDL